MSQKTGKNELVKAIDGAISRDIEVKGGFPLLRCTHYKYDGGDVYMFVNESVNEGVKTTVSLPSRTSSAPSSMPLLIQSMTLFL